MMHEPINKKHAMVFGRCMDCYGCLGMVDVGADLIGLTLPWPPSVNRLWRCVGGRVLLSADGRAYRQAVAVAVLEQHGSGDPLTGRLSMTIRAYPPDRRRRDLDNLLKAILDSLEHAGSVYVNDSQIDHLSIHRCAVGIPVQLEIQIWEHETDG
jgi:crossover junction endodeoxyribonuclease RusA